MPSSPPLRDSETAILVPSGEGTNVSTAKWPAGSSWLVSIRVAAQGRVGRGVRRDDPRLRPGETLGVVKANTLDDANRLIDHVVGVSFDAEDLRQRKGRREANWTPASVFEP